jgi:hypothetical protein
MKKSVAFIAALALVASAAFAQVAAGPNLISFADVVIPAEGAVMGDSVAPKEAKDKAPSGKDAVICQVKDEGGAKVYRWLIEFSKPYSIKGYKKVLVNWESGDESFAKGANLILSLFTLNKDDNKLLRAGTLDVSKIDMKKDFKKSILMAHGGFQTPTADFMLGADCQGWTDTTVDGSTKQVMGIEIYVSGVKEGKGFAVTDIHFE